MRTAVIAGATGLVGSFLLKELLGSPDYARVIAVGRRQPEVVHPKLMALVADFAALDKFVGEVSCDDAFCCLGTTIKQAGSREAFRAVDHGAVLAFAWAAKRAGATRFFVVSAMGADAGSRIFYNRIKGETEDGLRVMGFSTLAIFRPGLLVGPRKQKRLGETLAEMVLRVAEPLLVGSWRKYRAIRAEVVARAMRRCAYGVGQGVLVFLSDEIQDLGAWAPRTHPDRDKPPI